MNKFMLKALDLAKIAYANGEIPVGAVIINNNTQEIIASAFNLVETNNNALEHAEILAINQACSALHSKYLINCSIFCTLEPCTMCSGAISLVKLSRLYYGASDIKQGAVEHGIRFFTSRNCLHKPDIYPDLGKTQSELLLKKFFQKLRDKDI